jgi:hypothetical protein
MFSSLLSIRRIFFFVNIIYMNYYYYFNKKEDEKYSEIFNSINFVEGNKYFLLNQVKANSNFCRNQESIISYEYFVQCMEGDDIIIYITKNDSDNILGASSISIEHNSISIYSICVPKNEEIKGIGTNLLEKIKELATTLKLEYIEIYAEEEVKPFYIKNNFTEYGNDKYKMIYTLGGKPPTKKIKLSRKKLSRKKLLRKKLSRKKLSRKN